MGENQDFKCTICGKVDKLVVDHNHKTSKVRSLLCEKCNQGLGSFYDNPTALRKAADYIEAH